MILELSDILDPELAGTVVAKLQEAPFVDGRTTAGAVAQRVKHNQQVVRGSPAHDELNALVMARLVANTTFALATQPRGVMPLTFARYSAGMAYGPHVDNAIMPGRVPFRADVSFTLFLSDPSAYEGGELVLHEPGFDRGIKLPAGHLVLYPSTTLHEVRPVTAGERLVAVGWVHSMIRASARRELLMDLHRVRHALAGRSELSGSFDLMSKTCANLTRMWAEP